MPKLLWIGNLSQMWRDSGTPNSLTGVGSVAVMLAMNEYLTGQKIKVIGE